ncbi:hypothetical protein Dimus_033876 [Dionaea muscipula]
MVLNGRIDYRHGGYDAPIIPRAPRSIRGKGSHSRTYKEGQVCPFELLATVAGKLLQECESSSASSSAAVGLDHYSISKDAIKHEVPNEGKSFREHDEQGSSEESIFFSTLLLKNCNQKESEKLVPEIVGEAFLDHASAIASSGKVDSDLESAVLKADDNVVKLPSILEGGSPNCGEPYYADLDKKTDTQLDANWAVAGAKDADGFCEKSPAVGHSNEIAELSLHRIAGPGGAPFLQPKDDVNIGNADDDEIFSQSSQPTTQMKAPLSITHYGDRQIKKLSTSKCWKVAPKLKNSEVVDTGSKVKHVHRIRKSCHEHERSQRDTPFKKRKLFDQSSIVTYDGGNSSESVSNLPDKDIDVTKISWAAKLHQGNAMSSSSVGYQKSPSSMNSNVKLSIKSFKVPELFIEVPESATVGSLKKTVMEAVTAILGGGLRVGVLHHGKKVRDDDRTLQQAGISHNYNLDNLGFLLEPRTPTQPSLPVFSESPVPLTCDSLKNSVHRSQITPKDDLPLWNSPDKSSVADSGSYGDSSQDFAHCPTPELVHKKERDSRALIPVPETTAESLAMVPLSQRPRGSEVGQRRTRRPFSATEVEALVQAVEKLGTGRWRDVKLCSFENAKHRTYVDLKDKWKTLVHTARISPQQRRGEPVPQELLDRVLAAHAHWTQNQAKQHGKQQPRVLKITEVSAHN